MEYPDEESELALLLDRHSGDPGEKIDAMINVEDVIKIQEKLVRDVKVDESVARYIVEILNSSRSQSQLKTGCSPRTGLVMYRTSQAHAFLNGRDYVTPNDVSIALYTCIATDCTLKSEVKNSGVSNQDMNEFFDR